MPKKGWKTVTLPEYLYDLIRSEWEGNTEENRKKYGVRSFTGFLAEKVQESFLYDTGSVEPRDLNPLVESWLMEDLDDFIEGNRAELRKYLRIRNIREFVEESLELHMNYCKGIIERIKKDTAVVD